jgi:regulator of cell morphogenesis and NO signaling
MTLVAEKTVREIALENPATVRVFESLGIDYCCGGRRSLSEACLIAKVPLAQAQELLAKTDQSANQEQEQWSDAPLAELITHIVNRHHTFVRQELPRLEALTAKVASKHGPAHPELAAIHEFFTALSQELFAHLLKEEEILFPYIQKMEVALANGTPAPEGCFGTVGTPIARMFAEHDDVGELTAKIRSLSSDFKAPDDTCPSYRGLYHGLAEFERDLHRHIHLENNILFPRAVALERRFREVRQ